jgi:hypothetical protein
MSIIIFKNVQWKSLSEKEIKKKHLFIQIIYWTRGSQEPVSFTWLLKKTNRSYVKTMSCSGSHLGITINIKNTKFVKDLPMIDA